MRFIAHWWKNLPGWSQPLLGIVAIPFLPFICIGLALWGFGMLMYYMVEAIVDEAYHD